MSLYANFSNCLEVEDKQRLVDNFLEIFSFLKVCFDFSNTNKLMSLYDVVMF